MHICTCVLAWGGARKGHPSGVGSFLHLVAQGSNSGHHTEHQMPLLTEPSSQSHVFKLFHRELRVSSSHIRTSVQ